jgi:hypothetical protein
MRLAAILGLIAAFGLSFAAHAHDSIRPLVLTATVLPLSTGEEASNAIGKLRHRGTLRLTSDDDDFGGISGLIVSDDGERFLAITDTSHWLTGRLSYRDGKLSDVSGGEIGPLLGLDGKRLEGKGGDAEGLAGSIDGDVFVSFEGDHRIWRYAFGSEGLGARPTPVAAPTDLSQAPHNGGLEGITLLSDGRLLALTESFFDDAGNYRGWLIAPGEENRSEALALKPRMPFQLTDVRQLAGGDVLTLERRFSPIGGVGFQMRRIAGASVVEGAVLDGEVVGDAGMNRIIDNMEGLAVRTGADRDTLVYLVSDDNFNAPLQQTLIMMFELKE